MKIKHIIPTITINKYQDYQYVKYFTRVNCGFDYADVVTHVQMTKQ